MSNSTNLNEKPNSSKIVLLADLMISILASILAVMIVRWILHPIAGFQF